MTSVRSVATPVGEARLHVDRAIRPRATVVLGHGAGRGVDSADLIALARALPKRDITVVRVEQPWVVAGRRVAGRPETLDAATVACLNSLRLRSPLVLGGRSAGARVACRLARSMGAVACLALAFPLHPPGRPGSSRLGELLSARVPTLVVQGERDVFGSAAQFPSTVSLVPVPGGDHSFVVPKRHDPDQAETLARLAGTVADWVCGLTRGNAR